MRSGREKKREASSTETKEKEEGLANPSPDECKGKQRVRRRKSTRKHEKKRRVKKTGGRRRRDIGARERGLRRRVSRKRLRASTSGSAKSWRRVSIHACSKTSIHTHTHIHVRMSVYLPMPCVCTQMKQNGGRESFFCLSTDNILKETCALCGKSMHDVSR